MSDQRRAAWDMGLERPGIGWFVVVLACVLSFGACSGQGESRGAVPGDNDSRAPVATKVDDLISHGPVLLTLTESSAAVWLRSVQPADVQLAWKPANSASAYTLLSLKTRDEDDLSALFELSGLVPATCYVYEIRMDGAALPGLGDRRFCTLSSSVDSVRIGLLGDLDPRRIIEAPAIGLLADSQPDLVLLVGDWDHRDPVSLEQLWEMHRENRDSRKLAARPLLDRIFNRVPIAYTWDDHDYGDNNSDRFSPLREEALRAYDDYWPRNGRPAGQAGIWFKYRVSDLVEVFMLDTRSQRDPDTYRDDRFVPDNTPGSNRTTLRNDPARSMLDGAARPEGTSTGQKAWLKQSLLTSPALWKIVVSSVTWNSTTVKDDAWWDFTAERDELVSFIHSNSISGIIFVSADLHTGGGVDDGSNADFPEITIPSTNLNPDETGSPSCAIHPTPDRTLRTSCGQWSGGLHEHGSGYGLLTLDRTQAVIETFNLLGGTTSLTIPRP